MKKKNKKGIDVGASMPGGERYFFSLAQTHLNTVLKICLLLILASLILIYAGAFYDCEAISFLGLGIGASGAVIQAKINLEEDE